MDDRKRKHRIVGSSEPDHGSPDNPDYLVGLNDRQREAVLACSEPLLVLAGAGSGKTRVITTKIAHLIRTLGYSPRSILAVTFTNKAAAEMKERVARLTPGTEEVLVKTFHSFCAWLLRRFGEHIGLSPGFTIYDDDDALTLLHTLYQDHRRNELRPAIRAISRAKDYGLQPGDSLAAVSMDPKLPAMYAEYENKLRRIGNVDFGGLILRTVELLERHDTVREQIRRRFQAILVDEYQDSNVAQYKLLQLLYGEGAFICVVGDDDQSIYRFRGAELRNILTFPEAFPGTRIIKLEENYRSTGTILGIAEQVVRNNQGRHGKTLWTHREEGSKARLLFFQDQFEEARFCADLVGRDRRFDGTAVLYRTNAQSAAFETIFMQRNIPYKIIGALRFYDREEVKDALAILALMVNPFDEVSFRRIVNKPARGIGDTSLEKIISAAAGEPGGLPAGLRRASEGGMLRGNAATGAREVLQWYAAALEMLESCDLDEFTREILKASGIVEYHRQQDEVAMTQKVNNLDELVKAAGFYPAGREGIVQFLESLELDPTRLGRRDPSEEPGVTLITMHNTKGLEFDRVIITGLEEGLFPGRANVSDDDIEEERRIFYVSITRARHELYFTACRERSIWGKTGIQMPSRFLRELPRDLIEITGQVPAGSGLFGEDRYDDEFSDQLAASRYRGSRHAGGTYAGKGSDGSGSLAGRSSARGKRSFPGATSDGYPGFGKRISLDSLGPRSGLPDGEQNSGNAGRNACGNIPGSGSIAEAASASDRSKPGQRIYHDEFGPGTITGSRLDHGREVVDIRFDSGTSRMFIAAYVRLEKIAPD